MANSDPMGLQFAYGAAAAPEILRLLAEEELKKQQVRQQMSLQRQQFDQDKLNAERKNVMEGQRMVADQQYRKDSLDSLQQERVERQKDRDEDRATRERLGQGNLDARLMGLEALIKERQIDNERADRGLVLRVTTGTQEPLVRVNTVDEAGNEVDMFVPRSQATGQSFKRPPTAGAQQRVAGTEVMLKDVQTIENNLDESLVGPVAGRGARFLDRMGTASYLLDKDTSAKLFKTQQALSSIQNQILNLRSGAAITPSEAERIMGELPALNNDPEQFRIRLEATKRNLAALQQRLSGNAQQAPAGGAGVTAPAAPVRKKYNPATGRIE